MKNLIAIVYLSGSRSYFASKSSDTDSGEGQVIQTNCL